MARRREINPFGLTFLDAMTCGLGAVVLLYLIINAAVTQHKETVSEDLRAETNRLEKEVLEGQIYLVELRNSLRRIKERRTVTQGLSRRLLEDLTRIEEELATHADSTLARRDHVNKLKTDLKTLEEEAKRLAASVESEEPPGKRVRAFLGDGERQYLTGLKLGGKRILVLVDASASMLDQTVVNILRRRNMTPEKRRAAPKWQRAVKTVDWLSTQLPRDARFQIITFSDKAGPLIPASAGHWLDAADPKVLAEAIDQLKQTTPEGGTSLHQAFFAARSMSPRPDNIILLTDGLPTRALKPTKKTTVSSKERLKIFNQAIRELPSGVPVNVILYPMEGDPMAASAFWKLAIGTRGSFMCPSGDWP